MGLGSWVLTLTSLVRSISCSNACILATFSSGLVLSDRIDQSMEPKFVTKATIEILLILVNVPTNPAGCLSASLLFGSLRFCVLLVWA